MDLHEIFLGRQPILDESEDLVAYELLFRSSANMQRAVIDNLQETIASTIVNAMCDFGEENILGRHIAFINLDSRMLMSDMIELLPKDRVVFEIIESVDASSDIIERCRDLKRRGFMLALDDFSYDRKLEPLLELVDVVKIDVLDTTRSELLNEVRMLEGFPVKLLAEKVENPEQYALCSELGFRLFQGYYFARPAVLGRKRIDISKITLLKLLQQVMGDCETREIEETFKQSPELTYNLLRLVNSVGMGLRYKVRSVPHAIAIVGRNQLRRWVQLLLFIHGSGSPQRNPLLQLSMARGRLMELLADTFHLTDRDKEYGDMAFMTGVLSLLDVLLNMPMKEILAQIDLEDEVREALLDLKGPLGTLLMMATNMEHCDFESIEEAIKGLPITPEDIYEAQFNAVGWTNRVIDTLAQCA